MRQPSIQTLWIHQHQLPVDPLLVGDHRRWRRGLGDECRHETIEQDGAQKQEAALEAIRPEQILNEGRQGERTDGRPSVSDSCSRGFLVLEVLVDQNWVEGYYQAVAYACEWRWTLVTFCCQGLNTE